METGGLLKRKLASLGSQTADVMMVVKQQHGQKTKWQCHKDPSEIKIPEVNHPVPRLRWLESLHGGHECTVRTLKMPRNVRETGPEERRKHISVVGKNATEPRLPNNTAPELFETVNRPKLEYCYEAGEVPRSVPSDLEFFNEFFDALDHIDDTDVHSERLAGKVSDVAHVVAVIPERHYPVENGRPDTLPSHDLTTQTDIVVANDLLDGVVEEGYQTGDTDDRQGLAC